MYEKQNDQLENEPERYEVNTDQLFNSKRATFHAWKQRGPFLVCTSCDFTHNQYIGTNKLLTGIDEQGQPILKVKAK